MTRHHAGSSAVKLMTDEGTHGNMTGGGSALNKPGVTMENKTDGRTATVGPHSNPRWLFALGSFAVPLAMSFSSSPSPNHPRILAWYASLRKPFFQPPGWIFPIAWTALEGSLAFSGWRLSNSPDSRPRQRALGLLALNIVSIGAWSRLFFKRQSLPTSTFAAGALVATTAAYVRQANQVDPVAARAAVPLVVWVSFATILTGTLWAMNRR